MHEGTSATNEAGAGPARLRKRPRSWDHEEEEEEEEKEEREEGKEEEDSRFPYRDCAPHKCVLCVRAPRVLCNRNG